MWREFIEGGCNLSKGVDSDRIHRQTDTGISKDLSIFKMITFYPKDVGSINSMMLYDANALSQDIFVGFDY